MERSCYCYYCTHHQRHCHLRAYHFVWSRCKTRCSIHRLCYDSAAVGMDIRVNAILVPSAYAHAALRYILIKINRPWKKPPTQTIRKYRSLSAWKSSSTNTVKARRPPCFKPKVFTVRQKTGHSTYPCQYGHSSFTDPA